MNLRFAELKLCNLLVDPKVGASLRSGSSGDAGITCLAVRARFMLLFDNKFSQYLTGLQRMWS